MQRFKKLIYSLLLLAALVSTHTANAYDFMVSGLAYNINSGITVSVTYTEYYSDSNYSGLTEANIPDSVSYNGKTYSVTSIGDRAFERCRGLTSVTIPNSVTTIGAYAFFNCSGLTSVTIPNSVTYVGEGAFANCSGLTSIKVETGNTNYDSRDNCNAIIKTATNTLITGCKTTTIPNSVTTIGGDAFFGCRGLTSVTIGNSVTSIGEYAFYDCFDLTSVTIGNSVTTIGERAFAYCFGLTSVAIPNSVTTIGERAFAYCSGLTSVTIGNSVTSIGEYAFYYCTGLTSIYSKILNPNDVTLGYNVFDGVDRSSCILTVPVVSLNLYKAAAQWEYFRNIFPDVMVSSISLNKTQLILDKGQTEALTATVLPANAYSVLNWSSSDMSVATVDQNGKVTAKAKGYATITATATDGSGVSASCQVSVIIPVSSITLSQTSATINKGNSLTLTATVQPTNATNKTLSWSSSNTSVATVDQNGKVTAKAVGSATITATATDGSDVSASCQVTVYTPVSSITMSQSTASIFQSGTLTLTATVSPNDATNKTLNWTSSNTSVATVDQNGKVTAKAVGSATIKATATDGSGKSATCAVTVKGITNITLNKTATSLLVGDSETLTATITPSGVINKTLTWSSSNTNVATVDQNGKVTAKAVGSATIKATATDGSGVSASCLVTVVPDYSLTITPDVAHVRGTEQRTYELAINMSNRQAISGLQFNMKLPTGVSLVTDSYGDYDIWLDNDRKARNHTVGVEPRANNSYFVLISSPTNRTFSGSTGAVLHLTVQIDKFHSSIGDYAITLSDIVMAEADETQHTATSSQSTVRLAYLVGDANADVEVDVADYVVTANHLLNRDTVSHFFTDAANAAYDNSTINVTDLVAITNIALELREKEIKPGVEGYQLAPAVMPPGADYAVTAAVTEASADRTVVTVAVDNDAPLAAMQLDLDLPQGVTLERAAVTERATGMDAAFGTSPEGKARVILSSFGTNEIATGSGDVLTLILHGKAQGGELLKIGNVTMAERDLIEHGAYGDLSLDLSQLSGVGEVSCDRVNIYGRDGAVVIESPVAGTAQLVRMNGMSHTVTVAAGRNVYPVSVTHGDIIIATFNGITAKLQF